MKIAPHIDIDSMSPEEYEEYQARNQSDLERVEENELDISRGVWD